MTTIRTALIGCGKVGQIHAAALSSLPESEFVAVCDNSAERAEAFSARFGTRSFRDVPAMMRETRPHAVLICTPHPLHAEAAIQAAESGAHVLVEKPLAATLTDCDAMIAAAQRAGVRLGVVSQRRYYEPVRRMKDAIDAGKIGTPALGVFEMFSWRDQAYYQSDVWRGKWATEGGGVLVNQSPHQLDLLQWFMGEIDEVSSLLGQPQSPLYRSRGHRRRHPSLQERRPRLHSHQLVAEAWPVDSGSHSRLQRRVDRRRDRSWSDLRGGCVRDRRAALE